MHRVISKKKAAVNRCKIKKINKLVAWPIQLFHFDCADVAPGSISFKEYSS